MPVDISRAQYAAMYGPTTGDRVRLVGDPIAMVVVESRAVAEDAIEQLLFDDQPLTRPLQLEPEVEEQ